MTNSGWIIMIFSIGLVSALLAWCVYKVFSAPQESEHLHGFEQEPPDTNE